MTAKTATNNEPTAYVCRHLFTLGRRCGAPCLLDEEFCYYHRNSRRKPKLPITTPDAFEMPSIEDGPAIHLALQDVLCRLAANQINDKRAGKLLYGLQIAANHHARLERTGTGCPIHGSTVSGRTTSTSSRPTSQSDRDRPASRLPKPVPIPQATEIVQDVIYSPTHGPIAPLLEHGLPEPEEECEPSLASIINTYLNSPPPPPPVELDKRPYDFETLQLLRRTLATTENPETAARIRKALEEEALIPGHNLHIQACIDPGCPTSDGLSSDVGSLPSSTPTPLPCPIHGTAMSGSRRPKVRRLSHPFSRTCKTFARPTHPGMPSLQAVSLRLFKLTARGSNRPLNGCGCPTSDGLSSDVGLLPPAAYRSHTVLFRFSHQHAPLPACANNDWLQSTSAVPW